MKKFCILLFLLSNSFINYAEELTISGMATDYTYILNDSFSIEQFSEFINFHPDHYDSYNIPLSSLLGRISSKQYRINHITITPNDSRYFNHMDRTLNNGENLINFLKFFEGPPELQLLIDNYINIFEAELWLMTIKNNYFKTYYAEQLKSTFKDIDTSILCRDLIEQLKTYHDKEKIFKFIKYNFHNRINHEIRKYELKKDQLFSIWNNFINAYDIEVVEENTYQG